MKAAGAIHLPARRHIPLVPVTIAVGVALTAIGAGYVARGLSSVEVPVERPGKVVRVEPVTEDRSSILNADAAHVLRHRPGLEPIDFVRTHAFGWEGVTVGEVFDSPALMKELRLQPHLSPIDLIRMEARES